MKRDQVAVLVVVTACIAGSLGFLGHRIASAALLEPPGEVALLFGMGEHDNDLFIIRRHVLDPDQSRDPVVACLKLIEEARARHWQSNDLACVLTKDVESGQPLTDMLNLKLEDGS